ncbi:unnamed protein product [Moneuplotes crassus]|uniref:Uncharacterized protein n=1 Tax=Euplotes crassus TaxID=5936 RepID=A0AAD1XEH7_EUPCR|nr:unnamed protein product [Moneuplotes crassus]
MLLILMISDGRTEARIGGLSMMDLSDEVMPITRKLVANLPLLTRESSNAISERNVAHFFSKVSCETFRNNTLHMIPQRPSNRSFEVTSWIIIDIECVSYNKSGDGEMLFRSSDSIRKADSGKERLEESQKGSSHCQRVSIYHLEGSLEVQTLVREVLGESSFAKTQANNELSEVLKSMINTIRNNSESVFAEEGFLQAEPDFRLIGNDRPTVEIYSDVISIEEILKMKITPEPDNIDYKVHSNLKTCTDSLHLPRDKPNLLEDSQLEQGQEALDSSNTNPFDSLREENSLQISGENLISKSGLDGPSSDDNLLSEIRDDRIYKDSQNLMELQKFQEHGPTLVGFIRGKLLILDGSTVGESLKEHTNKIIHRQTLGDSPNSEANFSRFLLEELSICGDGVTQDIEVCDDGNQLDGDGCSADCKIIEQNWVCRSPGLSKPDVCYIDYKNSKAPPSSKWISDLSLAVVILSVIFNMISSIMNKEDSHMIFASVNQIQLMAMLLLLPFNLPLEVINYLKPLTKCLFVFDLKLPLLDLSELLSIFHYEQGDFQLYMVGLHSGSTLVNLKTMALLLGVSISLAIMLMPRYLRSKICEKPRRIHKAILKFSEFLTYFLIPVLIIEGFLVTLLSSLSEIANWRFEEQRHTFSLISSCLFYLFVVGVMSAVFVLTLISCVKNVVYIPEFLKSIRPSNIARFYHFSFFFRRFMLCMLIIFFPRHNTLLFLLAFIFMNYIQNLYILINNPFNNKLRNAQELMNEIFYLCFGILILIASQREKWDAFNGQALFVLLVINNMLNFAISGISLVSEIFKRFLLAERQTRLREPSFRNDAFPIDPPAKRHLSIKLEPIDDFEFCSSQIVNSQSIGTHEKMYEESEFPLRAPRNSHWVLT